MQSKSHPNMRRSPTTDFYLLQRRQWLTSLFLLLVLILFYILALGFVAFVFTLTLGIFIPAVIFPSGSLLVKLLLGVIAAAVLIASFQFYDARRFGARFIRRRLLAQEPDPADHYHKRFINTVEEMRIAGGLPKVRAYIIPAFAINSLALIEADRVPSVIVTEGLLAEFTRDELQAVIAHELAHITRGDTFYITLVCSLANFFERLRLACEPDPHAQGPTRGKEAAAAGGPALLYLALTISSAVMHLLSTLISRQREILADAAAVELNRNPRALARAIYQAHVKNSFVGDFNLTYSPLFIVPPRSRSTGDRLWNRIFNSHPPVMKRVKLLADMVPIRPAKIIEEIWDIRRKRREARRILNSPEETAASDPSPPLVEPPRDEGRIWSARGAHGRWEGPFTLSELLYLPMFSPLTRIMNTQEGIEAQAREFPQINTARQRMLKRKHLDPARKNSCPRCGIPLRELFYEGVTIKTCPRCGGKLVDAAHMERLIARREVAFSEHLIEKARAFKQEFMENPGRAAKAESTANTGIPCPECGSKMLLRPYSYHYIVPVDKCLSCFKIWFDTDELEILQILIETREAAQTPREAL